MFGSAVPASGMAEGGTALAGGALPLAPAAGIAYGTYNFVQDLKENPGRTVVENVVTGGLSNTFRSIERLFGFASGTDSVFSSPTMIKVAEAGAERVTVSPLAGAAHDRLRGGSSQTIIFQGPTLVDNYSSRRLALELRRTLAS